MLKFQSDVQITQKQTNYRKSEEGTSVQAGDSSRDGGKVVCNFWAGAKCGSIAGTYSKTSNSSTFTYTGGYVTFQYLANDCGSVVAKGTVKAVNQTTGTSVTIVSGYHDTKANVWKTAKFTLPDAGTWKLTFTCVFTGEHDSGEYCGFWVKNISYVQPDFTVTCKDYTTSGSYLGSSTMSAAWSSTVYGSDFGSSTTLGAYYSGYYYSYCTSATVTENDDAVVYRYFAPGWTIYYNANGGSGAPSSTMIGLSGDISSTEPTRSGYYFRGWAASSSWSSNRIQYSSSTAKDGTSSTVTNSSWTKSTYATNLGLSSIGTSITLYAQWESDKVNYTVNHYKQNLDGSYPSTPSATGTYEESAGTSVTPSVNSYTGFTSPSTQTKTVASDGSTIFNYYYTRNSYTVTYKDVVNSTSGTVLGSSTATKSYGASVRGSDKGSVTTDNYYYTGYRYSSDTSATVGTSGTTVYRIFTPAVADYKVYHYKQNLDGTYPSTPDASETFEGTVGASVTPSVKSYTGFTSPATQTKTVASDGSTTFSYYYTRNSYTVTYKDVVGSASGTSLGSSTASKLYGSTVRGSDKGSDTSENAYYIGYAYVSDTSATVGTSGATVYRYFKSVLVDVVGSVEWVDKSNEYNSRPDSVTVYLLANGEVKDQISGLVDNDSCAFSFTDLQKYDSAGNVITYTVAISDVESKNAPEDKYITSINGYVITNKLQNNVSDDEPEEETGFTVKGSISWDDNDNELGYRPETVIINLYMDGEILKSIEKGKNAADYVFTNLERYIYNEDGTVKETHTYKIEEVMTPVPSYVIGTETFEAYTITYSVPVLDTKNGSGIINITNTFNNAEDVIPVKPYNNSLTIQTNQEKPAEIIFKKMDADYVDNSVVYKDTYSDVYYNVEATNVAETISHLVAGKYEISTTSPLFTIDSIELLENEYVELVKEGDNYYLIIEETDNDAYGSILINLTEKDHIGYQSGPDIVPAPENPSEAKDGYDFNNYWQVSSATTYSLKAEKNLSEEIDFIATQVIDSEEEVPEDTEETIEVPETTETNIEEKEPEESEDSETEDSNEENDENKDSDVEDEEAGAEEAEESETSEEIETSETEE